MGEDVWIAELIGRVNQHVPPTPGGAGHDRVIAGHCPRAEAVVVGDVNLAAPRTFLGLECHLGQRDAGQSGERLGDVVREGVNLLAGRAAVVSFVELDGLGRLVGEPAFDATSDTAGDKILRFIE